MPNSLYPDQGQRSVGPDVGLNHLERLPADNYIATSKEVVREYFYA